MDKAMLQKATAYCAVAEHCETEVRKKLEAWKANPEVVDDVIEYLRDENFINDSRYCHAYVHDKFMFSKWGRIKIATMLRQKHLPQADIQEALANIDEQTYRQTLVELLEAKERLITFRDQQERKAKLARFAASRGFEGNLIFDLL